ncbi:MAG: hypothetical protein ABIH92_02065 [Nanoarchaeota archaeon]
MGQRVYGFVGGLAVFLASAGCSGFQEKMLVPPRERQVASYGEFNSLPPMPEIPEPQTTNSVEAREMIGRRGTLEEKLVFLNSFFRYIPDNTPEGGIDDWRSFYYSWKNGGGDCDNWAICSIVCLYGEGYPAKMMRIQAFQEYEENGKKKRRKFDHAVHLLEKDGLYGLNERRSPIPVEFESVSELMEYYVEEKRLANGVYLVDELPWIEGLIDSDENLRLYYCYHAVELETGIISGE